MAHQIGIDLGGTRTKIGEVHDGVLVWSRLIPSQIDLGPEGVVQRLGEHVRNGVADYSKVSAVGVGVPGLIRQGVLVGSYNFPGWVNVPLREMLEAEFARPIALTMDAEAIAAGEWQAGGHAGKRRLFVFTIGTGVGAAAVLDGATVGGAGGFLLVPQGAPSPLLPECVLLEHVLGGAGILRRARERAARGESALLENLDAEGDLCVETLVNAAHLGDAAAKAIWEESGTYLGWAAVNVAHIFLLDRVVVGGGIGGAGSLLMKPARAYFQNHASPAVRDHCDLVVSALGEYAGILGAAALAMKTG